MPACANRALIALMVYSFARIAACGCGYAINLRRGHRFRCTMRVDCGVLDPGTVIQAGTHACPSASTNRNLRTGAPAEVRSISSPR
jgi:hypothetical protein